MELKKKAASRNGRASLSISLNAHKLLMSLKADTGYSHQELIELAIKDFAKNLVVKP